jgi:hypothetical protein
VQKNGCSPTTKPEDKEFKIIPKATLVINPALRLESMRFREDVWISRNGPEALSVNPSLLFILKDKPMMTDYRGPSWNAVVLLMDQLIILTVKKSESTYPNHFLGRSVSHSCGKVVYFKCVTIMRIPTAGNQRSPSQSLRDEGMQTRKGLLVSEGRYCN